MERKIVVNDLEQYKIKLLGAGYNGVCYKTNDNRVFKKLMYPYVLEKDIEDLSKYESESFVFPEQLVYLNSSNFFVGYLMRFIDGLTIKEMDRSISIQDYINKIRKVEEDIAKLTIYRVGLRDVGPNNVMYTQAGIQIIDTDFYRLSAKDKYLYSENMKKFIPAILYPLIRDIYPRFYNTTLNKYYILALNGKFKPSDLINEILNELNSEINEKLNDLNDVKNGIKLIKKKIVLK